MPVSKSGALSDRDISGGFHHHSQATGVEWGIQPAFFVNSTKDLTRTNFLALFIVQERLKGNTPRRLLAVATICEPANSGPTAPSK